MKPLMNLINVATGIMYLCLLDRLPKHLQRILLGICNNQITLSLTEVVNLPVYRLLMLILVVIPDMVLLPTPLLILLLLQDHIISTLSPSVVVDHLLCQVPYLLMP